MAVQRFDKDGEPFEVYPNIHAVAPGEANITVTTTDGGKTDTCVVTVKAEIKTIADVLATVVGGFPNSSDQKVIPDNAWVADVPNKRFRCRITQLKDEILPCSASLSE